jgi:hypothetical protein
LKRADGTPLTGLVAVALGSDDMTEDRIRLSPESIWPGRIPRTRPPRRAGKKFVLQ